MTTFTVPFVHGKDRPRFTMSGKTYTTARTRSDMKAIREAFICAEKMQHGYWRAPDDRRSTYALYITTHRPLPDSRPKRIMAEEDTLKPDIDNVVKLVMDGLNGAAWVDDSQVIDIHACKAPRLRGLEREYMDISVIEDAASVLRKIRKADNG